MIEGEARRDVDVGHAQGTRVIAHVQDLATQNVVTDDRHAPRTSGTDGLRKTRLPAARVASDDDQPGGLGANDGRGSSAHADFNGVIGSILSVVVHYPRLLRSGITPHELLCS
jgi:hypothetical protein